MTKKQTRFICRIVVLAAMIGFTIMLLFPFFWMLSTSLKEDMEVFKFPIRWIPDPIKWQNYRDVWTEAPFLQYYFNTAKVTVLSTLLQLTVCSTAAYAFARMNFQGKNILFMIYLSTMMVPWHSIMIPQFILISRMGLYDSHFALILLQAFSAFGIFLLRQFFMGIPMEMSEAARIDGCSELRIFSQIILPLSGPGLAALTVFTFMRVWNDYLPPLIYIQTPLKQTLQIGLTAFTGLYTMQYGLTMAGTVTALIPIVLLFIFTGKYITQGIAFTGLKN